MAEMISAVIRTPFSLFQTDVARMIICTMRLKEAQQLGYIKHSSDSEFNIENTVRHNLESLNPAIAARRPWAILGPLVGVDNIQKNIDKLKVLIVGPRTEAEILLYMSMGFKGENVQGLDLITYSDFITQGDMHSMPFPDDSFGIVVFSWVLGYSTNQTKAVQEAIRVLNNQGYLCIGVQWDPTPIEQVSSLMLSQKGYTLQGTVTKSCDDLKRLLGKNYLSTVFETQPLESEKKDVGWITNISRIQK